MSKTKWVLLFMCMILATVPAAAQTQARFWVGGSAAVLLMNGTGTVGAGADQIDFDFTASFLDNELYLVGEGEIEGYEDPAGEVGLNWGNKALFGIKPAAGVKFNDQLGASAAYAIYFKKSSDETRSGPHPDLDVEVSVAGESEYTQKSLQLLLQYYPSASQPGFYLLGGMEFVSLTFKGTTTYTVDDADLQEELQDDYGEDWDNNDSTAGLMFGLGYDFAPQNKMSLFASATYSLAKYDDQMLLGDQDLELKVGGFAGEIGVKFFLGQ